MHSVPRFLMSYKKWWYFVNIIDVIIYSWCCTWVFAWQRLNELNNKCWNNRLIEKLYQFLNPYIKVNLSWKMFCHNIVFNIQWIKVFVWRITDIAVYQKNSYLRLPVEKIHTCLIFTNKYFRLHRWKGTSFTAAAKHKNQEKC